MTPDENLAAKFRALGETTRMRIFRSLMEGSRQDATASEICFQVAGVDKINSKISHHLKELRQAGLIEVKRQGRTMNFRASPEGVREILNFLLDLD